MNRLFYSLSNFATKEFCPEVAVSRTDVVPTICLTGLLGFLIGYVWFSSMYAIINTVSLGELPEETTSEVKEEPEETTSEEPGETSTEEEM